MPKIIAHALTGASIVVALHPKLSWNNLNPVFIGMLLAVCADFDLIIEWVFDVPDLHRGITHSLFFSTIVGLTICFLLSPGHGREIAAFTLAYLSHPLLDMSTSTTGGVKLFYPYSERYYHLGLTGIFELPVGSNITQILAWGKIELMFFLPILILVVFIRYVIKT